MFRSYLGHRLEEDKEESEGTIPGESKFQAEGTTKFLRLQMLDKFEEPRTEAE